MLRMEERAGGVVWLTIDRADAMNAISGSVLNGIDQAIASLTGGGSLDRPRALVITGAGDRAFCAGADLKERRSMTADDTRRRLEQVNVLFSTLAALPLPTIAAVNGIAFGGGLELALACDFRIAVDTAQLGLTEVRLGILPGAGGTQRLTRLVGAARAKEMILLGRRISAERALEIGLVHEVVPPGGLAEAVDRLVTELAGSAPVSVARAKEAIDRGLDVPLAEGLRIERACYEATLGTEDRDEGLRAFAEKRPPRWKGK